MRMLHAGMKDVKLLVCGDSDVDFDDVRTVTECDFVSGERVARDVTAGSTAVCGKQNPLGCGINDFLHIDISSDCIL